MTEESKAPPPQTEEEKQPSPIKQIDAPIEEASVAAAAVNDSQSDPSDNKRKLDDAADEEVGVKNGETEVKVDEKDVAKRQRVDESGGEGVEKVKKDDAMSEVNDQNKSAEYIEPVHVENNQNSAEIYEQSLDASGETMRKIQVPNNKVGALIGKAGETIRLLQNNSGVRIQIARDSETDPNSSTRSAELTGTPENINKAEQLIRAVIAEADAGGSPALVARNFGSAQSGSDVFEMQVPNEKAGVIIGKGGDTIKALQYKSQARIQLIPQHLPDGDSSKERTVRITGNKMQIETAKQLIRDVISQPSGRHSNYGGGNNHGYRHTSGPGMNQWGPHGSQPYHSSNQSNAPYNYSQQRGGPYNTQYPPQQSYDYPQQAQQRPPAPVQNPNSYDYYGAGNPAMGPPSNPPINYNSYGPPPAQNYGQPAYANNQAPTQQQGFYPQQPNTMAAPQANTNMTAAPVYNAAAPTQPYGPYGSAPVPAGYGQGYNQPPPATAAAPAAYGQPNTNYAPTGYAQYPQQQPQQPVQYAEQPVAGNNVNYGGYQGYGGTAAPQSAAGYGGYVSAPPASNPASTAAAPYDQSMAAYGKGVSPQPAAYGAAAAPQYEAAPSMYGHQA